MVSLENFYTNSLHFTKYIVNKKYHYIERAFWFMVLCVMNFILYFTISGVVVKFHNMPTVDTVEMDYFNWNISFPAVAFCTPYNIDRNLLKRFLQRKNQSSSASLKKFVFALSNVTLQNLDNTNLFDHPEVKPEEYIDILMEIYPKYYGPVVITNLESPDMFYIMTELGLCVAINSNVAKYDVPTNWHRNDLVYEKNSIQVTLYDGSVICQIFNFSYSFNTYVYSPDEAFSPANVNFQADIGYHTTMVMTVKSFVTTEAVRTMAPERRKCRYIDEPLSDRYPIYSYTRCLQECRIKFIKRICKCVPHFYKALPGEKICSLKQLRCLAAHEKEVLKLTSSKETLEQYGIYSDVPVSIKHCNCPNNCEFTYYSKYSLDRYPFHPDIIIGKIILGQFPKIRYGKETIYAWHDAIVKITALVNLCLGLSVISMATLIYILVNMGINVCINIWFKINKFLFVSEN